MKSTYIPWLLLALLTPGCASIAPQELEQLNARLRQCEGEIAELTRANASCTSDAEASQSERLAAMQALARCNESLDTANSDLVDCEKLGQHKVSTLEERERLLRAQLGAELTARDVEIRRLRGRLALTVLDRVLFASGSSAVRPEGQTLLTRIGTVLANGDEFIRVVGHTDDVPIGTQLKFKYESNWELSGARAASVVRFFQTRSELDPNRLEAVGRSSFDPVAPNSDENNRQKNRRVEIVLSARGAQR